MKKLFSKLLLVIAFISISIVAKSQSPGYVDDIQPVYKYFFYTGKIASYNAIVSYFYPASNPCSMCAYLDSLSPSALDGGVIYPNYYVILKKDGSVLQWSLADSIIFNSLFTHDTSKWYVDNNSYATSITPGTYEYLTVNNKGIATAGYNSVTASITKSFNTAYQASNTGRIYDLDFTIKISVGAALVTASDGLVDLQISANGSSGWTSKGYLQNANGAILSAQNTQTVFIHATNIPSGYYYRLQETTASGTVTYTYISGFETLRR